jgi:crotonobetainyl-CoA:carnitine CoA-transferase CaiB-like acyl-CoA transferase
MAARGFGYPQAAQAAPRLIWCSITGFGQDGPYADWAGHDLSYVGQSGLLAALSPQLPWHPGAMLAVPLGAMMAATGILAALLERGRTGRGCQIDISLAESASWLLSGANWTFKADSPALAATPDRRLYLCADGRFVSVAAAEPRTWGALCEGLGAADLAGKLGVRGDEADAVAARLEAIFATRPARDWVELLGPLGAAVNPVNRPSDLAADPQVAARRAMLTVAGETVPANPVRLIDADGKHSATAAGEPPLVGEHTAQVLAAAGFSDPEIAALRADGVI